MRKVMIKKWSKEQRAVVDGVPGLFYGFYAAYEELDGGAGNYTTALVELSDGTIEAVHPTNIRFVEPAAQDDELARLRQLAEIGRLAMEVHMAAVEWMDGPDGGAEERRRETALIQARSKLNAARDAFIEARTREAGQ